jgi:hypothetical protein
MDSRAQAAARIVMEMEKLSAVLWNILRPFGDILFRAISELRKHGQARR